MTRTRQPLSNGFTISAIFILLLALSSVLASADPPISLPAASPSPASTPLASIMPANSSAIDALQQDARLDAPITLDKTAVSLDDLTHELSRKGLLLFAGRNCENQRVHIRLNKRPLRDLMRALAELLPGEWKPRDGKSGYILIVNPAAIAYRERWQRLHLEDRECSYDVMRAKLLASMRGPAEAVVPIAMSNDGKRLDDTSGQTDYDMFHSLSTELQDRIAANINDIAIDTGMFSGDINEGSVSVPLKDLPSTFRNTINKDLTELYQDKKPSQDDVTVRFYNIGYMACMGVQTSDGHLVYSRHATGCIAPSEVPALRGGYEFAVRKKGAAAPAAWKELAAYEQSRVWKNDRPLHPLSPAWSSTRRSDLLTWIAARTGIEYVSDCYADIRRPMAQSMQNMPGMTAPPESSDIKELLNEIAAAHDVSWKQGSKSIYLLRNNRWYMDDFAEVPARLLQTWRTRWTSPQSPNQRRVLDSKRNNSSEDTPASTLTPQQMRALIDWRGDVSGSLTTPQIAVGFHNASIDTTEIESGKLPRPLTIYPFALMADVLLRERSLAHFFQSLTSDERGLLAEGRLPLNALAPIVQAETARLLPDLPQQAHRGLVLLGVVPTTNSARSGFVYSTQMIDPGPGLRLVIHAEPPVSP